jgi:hypothetical protein
MESDSIFAWTNINTLLINALATCKRCSTPQSVVKKTSFSGLSFPRQHSRKPFTLPGCVRVQPQQSRIPGEEVTVMEIVLALEERFNISLPDDVADRISTVNDIFEVLAELLETSGSPQLDSSKVEG